jgi:hypothetical protein
LKRMLEKILKQTWKTPKKTFKKNSKQYLEKSKRNLQVNPKENSNETLIIRCKNK